MNARSPYTCDTPGCTNWKEVFTPDGYVCEDCADELAEDYDAEPELVADGGIAWGDLSGFQRDILEAIAGLESVGMDPYGLAIEEDLEEYYGDVLHSRLYQNLDRLIDDGLVERSELDGRTNSYTLTPDAETLLEESIYRRAEACGLQVSEPEVATDGGVTAPDPTTVADELPTPDDPSAIQLPHSFLVTASGPVTRVSERSDATIEKRPVTVSIERRLETLAEFVDFWKLRDRRRWKAGAVETLLEGEDLETSYELTRSHIEDWDVVADGRVEAFAGLGQLMVDYDGAPDDTGLPKTIVDRLHLAGEDRRGVDEITIEFARDLRSSDLWGTGADLAYINAKHAQHEAIEGDLERVLENLQEGSA